MLSVFITGASLFGTFLLSLVLVTALGFGLDLFGEDLAGEDF